MMEFKELSVSLFLSSVQRFVSSVGFQCQRRLQPSSRDAAESYRLQRPAWPDDCSLLQHSHHEGTNTANAAADTSHLWNACVMRVQILLKLLLTPLTSHTITASDYWYLSTLKRSNQAFKYGCFYILVTPLTPRQWLDLNACSMLSRKRRSNRKRSKLVPLVYRV